MGQLGDGTNTARPSPVCLDRLFTEQGHATAIACGSAHSAAIVGGGLLYTWGANDRGQLGLGHKEACNTPQLVQALVDDGVSVGHIDLGVKYSIAVSTQRALYLWGRFHFGVHLGVEGRVEWDDPEEVTTAGVVEVAAAGRTHVLARTTGGACVMWGFVKPTARKPVTAPAPSGDGAGDGAGDDVDAAPSPTPVDSGAADDTDQVGAGGGASATGADDAHSEAAGGATTPERPGSPQDSYGGALESLTAILDLSPHALQEQQPGLSATPAPRALGRDGGPDTAPASDTNGGGDGAESAEALRAQLREAQAAAERARAEARAWETEARRANAKLQEAEADLARASKESGSGYAPRHPRTRPRHWHACRWMWADLAAVCPRAAAVAPGGVVTR